jgi:hypothetical protein
MVCDPSTCNSWHGLTFVLVVAAIFALLKFLINW